MREDTLIPAEIVSVAITNKGDAIFIRPENDETHIVPIFIRPFESQAIKFALSNVSIPRPLTHDLIVELLLKLKVTVERVEITHLREKTFYSRIVLKQGLKRMNIDARPSDSINIALRYPCQLFIAESIIEEASVNLELIQGKEHQPEAPKKTNTETLEKMLERAIAEEDYEEAAHIRDQLLSES